MDRSVEVDVMFAVLPFADIVAPAIGVSTLKAQLGRCGFTSHIRYFSFDLAQAIGVDVYQLLTSPNRPEAVNTTPPTDSLIGEWFFAKAAFGDDAPDDDEYRAQFLVPNEHLRSVLPQIFEARARAEDMVDAWVLEIRSLAPRVVGFTTVFHQTCACLAVARRLKQLPNPPVVVFGGANCAGPMGVQMVKSFPWIDYVCIGEGDEVFPEFLRRLLRDGDPRPIPGIVGKANVDAPDRAPIVRDMDAVSTPDYSDFHARQSTNPVGDPEDVRLLIETSRGCWWGAKHHCTFCGLNAETMTFRAKSADRVLAELQELRTKYGMERIDCVDNILHMKYLHTLFPRLAETGLALDLFYEVKANLRYDQLKTLSNAGVTRIQAGIESFSDDVLDLMRKGCTGLQNIQLLRWSAELGIDVIWNILYGFPGEHPDEYRRMAKLVPLLVHLRKPSFFVQIRLDRFSPNFMEADRFELATVRRSAAYPYVFPLPEEDLAQLAYFFSFEYRDGRDPNSYTRELGEAVAQWERLAELPPDERPRLDLFDAGTVALVEDTRPAATEPVHVLRGAQREAYLMCDTAHNAQSIAEWLEIAEHRVGRELAPLVRDGLMVRDGDKYLSLAVFQTRDAREDAEQRARSVELVKPRSSSISA